MLIRFEIELPQNLSLEWTEDEITRMAEISIHLEHMWHHAIYENWKNKIDLDTKSSLQKNVNRIIYNQNNPDVNTFICSWTVLLHF